MRALLMRLALVFPLLLALACNRDLQARPPTNTRLYYPTGLAFVPPEDLDAGVGRIYVASSNFDRRFDVGWVTVLDLAQVRTPDGVRSLPPPGVPIAAPPDGGSDQGRPVQFTRFTPDAGPAAIVNIASFAGLATVDLARKRLFIPSRAENDFLAVMDVSTPADGSAPLRCFFSGGTDCTVDSIDMAVEQTPGSFGIPAAPQPYSVTLATDTDEFYVTHLRPASSPAQSLTNLQNFLVRMTQSEIDAARAAFPSAGAYVPPASDFTPIGAGASNSIVVNPGTVPGAGFLYVSGRAKINASDPDVLLRVVDRETRLFAFPQIGQVYAATDARGLQRHPDGTRVYLAVDNPASLVVLDVQNPQSEGFAPSFSLVRAVPLPEGPNDVQLITRPGHAPLVIISCSVDGSLAFYDDDLGQIAALVPGVGAVPFAIAVDRRDRPDGSWARLYVSNFGDGRVAVVDVPLSDDAADGRLSPRLVGHIGPKQYCLIATDDRNCVDTTP